MLQLCSGLMICVCVGAGEEQPTPALQVGGVPPPRRDGQELRRLCQVGHFRWCGSRIRIFSIPGSASKNLSILTQKIAAKLTEIRWFGLFLFIPDPDPGSGSWFLTHPGSKGQKGTGSRIRIRNTGRFHMPPSLDPALALMPYMYILSWTCFCFADARVVNPDSGYPILSS